MPSRSRPLLLLLSLDCSCYKNCSRLSVNSLRDNTVHQCPKTSRSGEPSLSRVTRRCRNPQNGNLYTRGMFIFRSSLVQRHVHVVEHNLEVLDIRSPCFSPTTINEVARRCQGIIRLFDRAHPPIGQSVYNFFETWLNILCGSQKRGGVYVLSGVTISKAPISRPVCLVWI